MSLLTVAPFYHQVTRVLVMSSTHRLQGDLCGRCRRQNYTTLCPRLYRIHQRLHNRHPTAIQLSPENAAKNHIKCHKLTSSWACIPVIQDHNGAPSKIGTGSVRPPQEVPLQIKPVTPHSRLLLGLGRTCFWESHWHMLGNTFVSLRVQNPLLLDSVALRKMSPVRRKRISVSLPRSA